MGFSCQIFQGNKQITDNIVHYQLLSLGPNCKDDTDAPFHARDFRHVVANASYADRLKDAAQDCFLELQRMARANLESLKPHHECPCCKCESVKPEGWSAAAIKILLSIDHTTITKINGGY